MTTFDFSPLYRTTVGFDRLASLLASARKVEQGNSYPPYNIKSTEENHYQISMAVAGFAEDELDISYEQNVLTVSGNRDAEEENDGEYLYRGIAKRSFERKFSQQYQASFERSQVLHVLLSFLHKQLLNV